MCVQKQGDEQLSATRSVIFDLDGTLIDPFVGVANACAFMCERLNLPMASPSEISRLVGPPLQDGIREVFGLASDRAFVALALFRQYYGSIGLGEFSVYPGISNVLRNLSDKGLDLYVATSKPVIFAKEIVRRAGWHDLIADTYGADLDGSRSEKASVLKHTVANLVRHEPILAFVGDRVEDVLAAKSISLPFIGVTWGYSEVKELIDAGAHHIANTPDALKSLLEARLTI